MPSTKDIVSPKGLFALFKGAPNTRKSTAALSFPGAYVMDFDRKMPSVAQNEYPGKEVNWDTFDDVFAVSDVLQPWLSGFSCPYETIIIDTVTSLSTTCLRSIDKTKGVNVIELLKKKTKDGQVDSLGFDYYKGEMQFFERYFIDNLKILWAREGNPKHIIVIAHELVTESTNVMTGKVTRKSTIVTAGEKVATFIPKNFDDEYVFKVERPIFGDQLSRSRSLCITSSDIDENARKTNKKFPDIIDFTTESFYDQLNAIAGFTSSDVSELPINKL